jgi:hypothetical protein
MDAWLLSAEAIGSIKKTASKCKDQLRKGRLMFGFCREPQNNHSSQTAPTAHGDAWLACTKQAMNNLCDGAGGRSSASTVSLPQENEACVMMMMVDAVLVKYNTICLTKHS